MKLSELKFKVKLVENNKIKIHIVRKLRFLPSGEILITYVNDGEHTISNNREDVELLMGSHYTDKDGKTIFHGDIVKDKSGDICAVKFNPGDGFVWYNPNCCSVCKDGFGCIETLEYLVGLYGPVEVVGNIWENYKLIPNKKDDKRHGETDGN